MSGMPAMQESLPETVYKYTSAERGLEALVRGLIRFTQPGALNDPFEALPCMTQWKASELEKLKTDLEARQLS